MALGGIGSAAWAGAASRDPASERTAEAAFTAAYRGEARVAQETAEQAAQAVHPGAVGDTHLENEGHGLRWETKIDNGSGVWEVQVDSATGRIVSSHADD